MAGRKRAGSLRREMFTLLKRGGYDRVEVDYEGNRGVYTAENFTFYKGDSEVSDEAVPAKVTNAVWAYIAENIPEESGLSLECDGTARIYTPSEYACFEQYATTLDRFWDGDEPGLEVPERDIYPSPFDEESFGEESDFGVDDDEDFDDDDEDEDLDDDEDE